MKVQYLGDSKDCFKWDYHDYLTMALGYPLLKVVLMLTPDDKSKDGGTAPDLFPARKSILEFCRSLRATQDINSIYNLPLATQAAYRIGLHKPDIFFSRSNRSEYFSGFSIQENHIIFLDPDNGFEPEKSRGKKHILYSEIDTILDQVSDSTVISVFHHFRRIPFQIDYTRICERLIRGYSTAIIWHSLMFVAISKSKNTIDKVKHINQQYAKKYPVKMLSATCSSVVSNQQGSKTIFDR
jgi:hypothetical protein